MSKSKNVIIYILSFLIPIIFILLSCISSKIFPFGNGEFLYSDCNIEYIHFLSYLKHTFFSNDNLIYSLSNTGGNEMISFSSHYLLSPLNLITLLFPNQYINLAIQIIMILKLAFCGLFFAIFLNKTFESRYPNIVFAVTYALSSYNLMNISNFMYFDGIALLPITILGIYEIVKKNKYMLYITSISATIIFNSFIGYVVLLFSFLFFIYLITIEFLAQNKKVKEIISNIKTYIFSTVISLGLTSVLLIPLFLSLNGSAKYSFFELSHGLFEIRASVFEVLTKFLTGAFEANEFISAKTPHLSVGIFILILVILYFANKAFSKKERAVSGIFLLTLFLSFIINILFTTWNMGVETPCGTIFRFGFIFEFYLVYIAYISFLHLDSLNKKNIIVTSLLFIPLFTYTCLKNEKIISIHMQYLIFDISFYLSFIILLVIHISKKLVIKNKSLIIFVTIFLLHFLNLFLNTEFAIYSQPKFHFATNYKVFPQYYNRINNALKYIYSIDDNKYLYRIETNITNLNSSPVLSTYINAPFTFGYSALSGHTSNADNDKTMFYYYIGMPSKNNYYNISYTTNTMNFPLSLMGGKVYNFKRND